MANSSPASENRRDVSSRKVLAFHRLAQLLVKMGLHPNHISIASVFFGILSGIGWWATSQAPTLGCRIGCLALAIVGIQLRLVCNLIDGLMAVEGGLKTPAGELYNDIPDRLSDWAILVGMGYGGASQFSWLPALGWTAAILAILTAYIRVLGGAQGLKMEFLGPMAKQHRMAVATLTALVAMIEAGLHHWGVSLAFGLGLIAFGSALTCFRRTTQINRQLWNRK